MALVGALHATARGQSTTDPNSQEEIFSRAASASASFFGFMPLPNNDIQGHGAKTEFSREYAPSGSS
jgi:hypothetical protein